MSCKGKICTVQHRNPDCRGGPHAKALRKIREENERLRTAVVMAEDHLTSNTEVVLPVLREALRELDEANHE